MSRKIKRKLNIGDEVYFWAANCNELNLYPYSESHIRVHQDRATKSILYVDISAWHFVISPKDVKEAIEFALLNHWDPKIAGRKLYISKNENGYRILPDKKKHEFETY